MRAILVSGAAHGRVMEVHEPIESINIPCIPMSSYEISEEAGEPSKSSHLFIRYKLIATHEGVAYYAPSEFSIGQVIHDIIR